MKMSTAVEEPLRQVTGLPVSQIRAMDEVVSRSTSRERFHMLLMSVFGSVALLLAAIGIYGLMAYSVEQRTHEIGIRDGVGGGTGKCSRNDHAARNDLCGGRDRDRNWGCFRADKADCQLPLRCDSIRSAGVRDDSPRTRSHNRYRCLVASATGDEGRSRNGAATELISSPTCAWRAPTNKEPTTNH